LRGRRHRAEVSNGYASFVDGWHFCAECGGKHANNTDSLLAARCHDTIDAPSRHDKAKQAHAASARGLVRVIREIHEDPDAVIVADYVESLLTQRQVIHHGTQISTQRAVFLLLQQIQGSRHGAASHQRSLHMILGHLGDAPHHECAPLAKIEVAEGGLH